MPQGNTSMNKIVQLLGFGALLIGVVSSTERRRLPSGAFAIPGTNATFDYIVVGGGTGGLAIASRLAESASVAVVEAGGFYEQDNGNQSVVPFYSLIMPVLGITPSYPRQPLIDWDLISVPQTQGGNRRIHYAQGKTLGGSSALNTLAYLRGTKGAYQRWTEAVGDNSYSFDNLLPYFKKSSHLTRPDFATRNTSNATFTYDPSAFDNSIGGPLQVSWAKWVDPTQSWLAKGLQAAGLPLSPDGLNSGNFSGYGAWTTSMISPKRAERSSSESSYLREAIEKTEILVYHHTQASKVNFNQGKASSVSVSTQGLEYTLSATKEIIVSAGAIHTPQLLMVSGIGPRSVLESHNIPVVADLSGVGQNLQDQIFFNVLSGINTPSVGGIVNDPANSPRILQEYLQNASGPYSSAGGYLAFEKLPKEFRSNFSNNTATALASLPSDWPEIEYIVSGFPDGAGGTLGALSATLLAPFSRGNVTISSSNIADPPVFDLGWLTNSADTELAVAALKRLRQVWNVTALDPVKVGPEIVPGSGVVSDADILAFIRNSASPIWHISSTCSMGKKGDTGAVVDSTARVFGVDGLRVVDASIFPFALPAHPSATIYALAEKIAEAIKLGK